MAKVFVSYAHESAQHKALVLAFATFLRDTDVELVLDHWATGTRQDWYAWAIREMTAADFVIVVASERYLLAGDGSGPSAEHRGVTSEAALLRELVYRDRATWLPKILPVVLPGHTVGQIPLFLQPHTASHYHVPSFDPTGAKELLGVVHGQPVATAPAPTPPPQPVPPGRVVNQINGTVHGKILQADIINGDVIF
jgi:hypothetical protein